MNNFCSNCGSRLRAGARFCDSCGMKIAEDHKSEGWLYENFLRRDGRLNRWRYFKRGILVGIMGIVLALILSIIVAIVTSSEFLTGLTFVVAVTFIGKRRKTPIAMGI